MPFRKKRRFKGKKIVNANKCVVDGIRFASSLEVYMYQSLKTNDLFELYEEETFTLLDELYFPNSCYERQTNGKGSMEDRSMKKVRGITYTPDFTGKDFIIETKGRANDAFPLRWKLFKAKLIDTADNRTVYKPQSQKDCDEVIKLILTKSTH